MYSVLLRPHLESAAPIWDPNLIKGTTKLENVQKFALKMCLKQWDLGYQDLLDLSQFPPLENHKLYLNLCTLYKIIQGYLYFPVFLLLVSRHSYSLPSVQMMHGRTNAFQSSFYIPSSVSVWNHLPHEALTALTINSFVSLALLQKLL